MSSSDSRDPTITRFVSSGDQDHPEFFTYDTTITPFNYPYSSTFVNSSSNSSEDKTTYLHQTDADYYESDINNLLPDKDQNKLGDYVFIRTLGKGAFGTIFLGYDLYRKIYVAIKTIKYNNNVSNIMSVSREVEALKFFQGLSCKNWIQCYYDSFVAYYDNNDYWFIISEYIDGPNLTQLSNENFFSRKENILNVYDQMIKGLKYIHGNGWAHRDIKPDNIMFSKTKLLKYIDFGLACFGTSEVDNCQGHPGTLVFSPPEYYILGASHGKDRSIFLSQAHDIWSLGITFFQIANGMETYPFYVFDSYGDYLDKDILKKNIIDAPTINSNNVEEDINIFIDSILINDPRKRPSIYQVEEYFQQIFNKNY